MTMTRFATAIAAAATVAGLALAANPASAATAMADCNKQWNDNKAANKTNGATYQDFLKSCLKAAPAADAKATDAKAADTKAAADKTAAEKAAADAKAKATADMKAKTDAAKAKADTAAAKLAPAAADTAKAKSADAKTAAADPADAAKKDCNKQWKALKDAGTEGTQKKKDFVGACLTKAGIVVPAKLDAKAADTAKADEPTPPEPTATAAATAAKTTDVNGKARTPGQLAMDKRIKECGVLWQKSKGADGLVNGLKWPQYWSQCNTKMKAAGG
jgi:hypothetical protein